MAGVTVLGIESSCDDTGVGVVRNGEVRANVVASQLQHAAFGGVMPEIASREHTRAVRWVADQALERAGLALSDVDVIAATRGPGLAGSLLVGLNFAKGLALATGKPLYGIHHLEGHLQSALAADPLLQPPYLALVVSGGHTHLFDALPGGDYRLVGATMDDAAGEAFDKVARVLGLGYPGGPAISQAAQNGDPATRPFPLPLRGQKAFDFSFSGLKTAARLAADRQEASVPDLAASFQAVVIQALVGTTERAALALGRQTIIVAGGVAANRALREAFQALAERRHWTVHFPPGGLNTDNGAMIALAGYVRASRAEPADGLQALVTPYLPLAGVA
ncbi:MAG TPA: tRNA (adenosine(37)-N6)-threonylcarbamoyltransferase complex transferase subunit TsaD [Deinococcales bacterium]|nr:tRNA (adenosine(37)-N6)-threonylcarbamoyltransferase complex transferase subunit TsaD [Deinococcales bacterium]